MEEERLSPGLYVAATPIGHLGDVSRRLIATLAGVDEILCEDTRVSAKLLQAIGVKTRMRPYHDHNGAAARPGIIAALEDGAALALISDAGTPLISDPGMKLVRDARAAGVPVIPIPGPTAVTTALSISGAPTDRFSFLGFLPPKTAARRKALEEVRNRGETLVFYETAPRLAKSLEDIGAVFGANQPVQIARELTKRYEEMVDGSAAALAARYADAPPKGELVVILPPGTKPALSEDEVDRMMEEALKTHSLKDAAALVADTTGGRRRDLYQRWLTR